MSTAGLPLRCRSGRGASLRKDRKMKIHLKLRNSVDHFAEQLAKSWLASYHPWKD